MTLTSARSAGAVIPVTNFDFETGGLADGEYSLFGSATIPSGWTGVNMSPLPDYVGYFNPDDGAYIGTSGDPDSSSGTIGTMSGPNIFYFGSSGEGQGIEQTVPVTFDSGSIYQLTVSVGARDGGFMNPLRMELVAGTTVVATMDALNPDLGSFSDYTLTYSAGSASASLNGQALTIRLLETELNDGTEVDIDNVRLTSQSVPEPAAAFIGAGGLLVAALRRRRP